MKRYGLPIMLSFALATGALVGCSSASATSQDGPGESIDSAGVAPMSQPAASESGAANGTSAESTKPNASSSPDAASHGSAQSTQATSMGTSDSASGATNSASDSASTASSETEDLFTDRDLEQTADTSSAKKITVANGQDISITEEGIYVLSGIADDCTITVDADDSAKVQLVLDNLSITNDGTAAIYVASADKVFVTTAEGSTNTLTTRGDFDAVGDDNIDGVIFAKDDIVFNGEGTLTIESSDNGIVGKDDVKVTGGTYQIKAGNHAIQGKDSVAIAEGVFDLEAAKDGIHAENSDDQTRGSVYIKGGTFTIDAASDGIEGDATVIIDGGTFKISSKEGLEGTFVQINDGTIDIEASDDGINATSKSSAYDVALEINGGDISVDMSSGDTDALDSNGSLTINGGTIDITAQSPFDYDGEGQLNGGTVTVNGEQISELTNQMMGRGPGGNFGQGGGARPDMGQGGSERPDVGQGGSERPDMGQGHQGGPGMGHGGHGPKGSGSDGQNNSNQSSESSRDTVSA